MLREERNGAPPRFPGRHADTERPRRLAFRARVVWLDSVATWQVRTTLSAATLLRAAFSSRRSHSWGAKRSPSHNTAANCSCRKNASPGVRHGAPLLRCPPPSREAAWSVSLQGLTPP